MDEEKLQRPVQKKKKHLSGKKKVLIVLTIVVVVAIVTGVFTWLYLTGKIGKAEQLTYENTYDKALSLARGGDYSSAKKLVTKAVDGITDSKEQASYYRAMASVALNSAKYDDAYDYAKKVEAIEPSSSSAKQMAAALAGQGKIADAIEYYKTAIDRVKGDDELAAQDRDSLQYFIDELEAIE